MRQFRIEEAARTYTKMHTWRAKDCFWNGTWFDVDRRQINTRGAEDYKMAGNGRTTMEEGFGRAGKGFESERYPGQKQAGCCGERTVLPYSTLYYTTVLVYI
jgi:hypothetical protein